MASAAIPSKTNGVRLTTPKNMNLSPGLGATGMTPESSGEGSGTRKARGKIGWRKEEEPVPKAQHSQISS